MKIIPLSRGLSGIVDDVEYPWISQFKWCVAKHNGGFYVMRRRGVRESLSGNVYLHRELMNFPPCQVDHRNGDTLDNRRENLRLATNQENQRNCGPHKGHRFKGVAIARRGAKVYWEAYWTQRGLKRHIGYFPTEEDAARAYDVVAIQQYGEFARTNWKESGSGC